MEDICDKLDKNRRNYEQSEKGKAKNRRYNLSDKGKESRKKYFESNLGQAALLRWQLSEKAVTARQKRHSLEKLFRLVHNYQTEHPEASLEEALEEITKGGN